MPEKYAVYVKARKVISLDAFIRRSTGLTADMLGLEGRGYLKPGYFADVALIDLRRYQPQADYLHPRRLSTGVVDLLVNGRFAIEDGRVTGALAGRAIRHRPTPGSCPSP